MKRLKFILGRLWELPQNIIGWIVLKCSGAEFYAHCDEAEVYIWKLSGGLSLGKYIFTNKLGDAFGMQRRIRHEYGHCLQSKRLGWLYLIVIGLPSLIWAGCFKGYRKRKCVSYYAFYTEKWADKLGNIERDDDG